jgi:aldehyde dehydrogenase (NAD+)
MFDASCGFGGYRESGYGREGGREGMYEYLEPTWLHERSKQKHVAKSAAKVVEAEDNDDASTTIDRTVKQYIGGKQARPDSGYSFPVYGSDGKLIGEAPLGNRKDIRNAVEAERKAVWGKTSAHNRAQVLYYMAENLSLRQEEIARRLSAVVVEEQARREVAISIERIFTYAAWADKFDGAVHNPPSRTIAIAMNEAIGTVGVVAPNDAPLLGLLSLVLPNLAAGNSSIVVPSETYPLIIGDLYQIFDTSDLPDGTVNLVTGRTIELLKTIAEHDDVDAVWCFSDAANAASTKSFSAGNLKQVFTNEGRVIDWYDPKQAEGRWFLQHATQVKNVWVPYGE